MPYRTSGGGGTSIPATIASDAASLGLPSYIPLDIAQLESGFTNKTVYDVNGYAYGPFQEHSGFGGASTSQLQNVNFNILNAEKAMLPAYQKGKAEGLSGLGLLDFVANNSGWPLETGVAAANKYEPTYDQKLSSIYGSSGGSSRVSASAGRMIGSVKGSVSGAQDAFVGWAEKMDSELSISHFNALNPIGSVFKDGRAFSVRFIFFALGFIILVLAFSNISNGIGAKVAGMGGESDTTELGSAAEVAAL